MTATYLRVRTARRRAGHSQAALAKLIGVSRSSVAQWEQVNGCSPTTCHLSGIAVATRVRFEWLATGRGRMQSGPAEVEGPNVDGVQLNFFAHDEVEERVLLALRRLEYWQTLVVAELAESLALGRLQLRKGEAETNAPRGSLGKRD